MINLRSLFDLLPYYFKENDTYKVSGKGLLERYLDIFGSYFDDVIVNDINHLNDILDVDTTPDIYLGYLWEFLGSMPYANPKAIDPEKWKEYFNGFDNDSTIQSLSKLWVYRKDMDGDHYNLDINQVRALVKYSIALFNIRSTKKFFEVLLRLYGFEVEIDNGSVYPDTEEDQIIDPSNLCVETKLDSEWSNLDKDTFDNHTDCITRIVNVNFKLRSTNYVYNVSSNEFKRLYDRMFNLINIFLPIGTRPHLIWDNVNVGNNYVHKVNRYLEVYVNRPPLNWTQSDNVFVPSLEYPGWYRVYDRSSGTNIPSRSFDWLPLKFMVRVKDSGEALVNILDQPKRFVVAFDGTNYSDTEYDDGYVFTLNPGNDNLLSPKFKVSVVCEDDFDLTNGTVSTFLINKWSKLFNYTLFKHLNRSGNDEYKISINSKYIPVIVQSAFVRTYTNDANPEDDNFEPKEVINLTTGEYLTLCFSDTELPDRDGNMISYSTFQDRCVFVQHLFETGVYEFAMVDMPEYRFSIEVTRDDEVLTAVLVSGLPNNYIDNDNPICYSRIQITSNLYFLKSISTLPLYFSGGDLANTVIHDAEYHNNSPLVLVGNRNNKPYYYLESPNIYGINSQNWGTPLMFDLVFLNNAINTDSQYIRFVIKEFNNVDNPTWYIKTVVTLYLLTGRLDLKRETYSQDIDGEDQYNYQYGDNVVSRVGSPLRLEFSISDVIQDTGIDTGGNYISVPGVNIMPLSILSGIRGITTGDIQNTSNQLYFEYNGIYDNEVLIKEVSNPLSVNWNNGEIIGIGNPGHYRFYGTNIKFDNATSNHLDISVLSNKYNVNYYLELADGDKSDDESYMLRTLIPSIPTTFGSTVDWGFDFYITVNKSVIEAQDIQIIDPNAFDLEVLLYYGGNPNRGTLLGSYTATLEVLTDSLGNLLPNYKVKGSINLSWNGTYGVLGGNYPPGLYCVELHDKNHVWENTSSYRVIDAYVVPQKFDGNLYFDVDVISKAWTSPAGQIYDIDPITGKYTWGWFKANYNYQHSVRLVRYDPSIGIPQFRLKLTNNTIGYTRVYLYKLVDSGSEWDINANYPEILTPIVYSPRFDSGVNNPHWLLEAIPKDWGFPGDWDDINNVWDYGKSSDGIPGYTGRWLFTGSVYQLGEIITGPQEPGKYLFIINQLDIDSKSINYAFLEVRENIRYSLIVDPLIAVLQGTVVGTTIDAISSAKFTNEVLEVRVTNPDSTIVEGYFKLPYAFYADKPGTYTFELFKFEGGEHISLGLTSNFKVLTDNGVYDEYLYWEWSDVSDREVQVATTSNDIVWTVKVQDE